MKNSVVEIKSVSNSSFGTGFVIDSDERGIYILTCGHVLDDVVTPVVENVLAKVIAKGKFIDMAVLYVSKIHLTPLPLQVDVCNRLDVEVIGFSSFNQSLTQKKHIKAKLYQEAIELHSKEDELFYTVRKIKANDGFNFDRGNSGSPVICQNSGKVIAMVSNKEGSSIGYAIDISNLKTIWHEMPIHLLQKSMSQIFPSEKKSSLSKYLLLPIVAITIFLAYEFLINKPHEGEKEKTVIHKENRKPTKFENAVNLENEGLQALIDGQYMKAKDIFKKADSEFETFDIAYDIYDILNKNKGEMGNRERRIKALREIIKITNRSKYINSKLRQGLIEKVDKI